MEQTNKKVKKTTTSTKNTKVNSNIDSNIDNELINELQEQKRKNEELESKLNMLMSMINKQSENKQEEQPKQSNRLSKYLEIEPTKRVLLMHMIYAGGTYKTADGRPPIRFDGFGSIQPIRFEDLQHMVTRYRNRFQNLEIKILDDDIVDALYLRDFYNKNNITDDEIRNIINLNPQALVDKIKSLPRSLQESALSLIIDGVSKNDSMYMDRNKWQVINNAFNIDIENFARTYVD